MPDLDRYGRAEVLYARPACIHGSDRSDLVWADGVEAIIVRERSRTRTMSGTWVGMPASRSASRSYRSMAEATARAKMRQVPVMCCCTGPLIQGCGALLVLLQMLAWGPDGPLGKSWAGFIAGTTVFAAGALVELYALLQALDASDDLHSLSHPRRPKR